MKKITLFIVFWGIVISNSLAQGIAQSHYDYSGFNAVSVSGVFSVYIEKGDKYSVTVISDDHIVDRLKVEMKEKTLYFYMEEKYKNIYNVRAHIVMPELTSVVLTENSKLISEDIFTTEKFNAVVSGGTHLELKIRADKMKLIATGNSRLNMNVEVSKLESVASGGSMAILSGKVMDFFGTASGNSKVDASKVAIHDMKLILSGGCKVTADAQGDRAEMVLTGNSHASSQIEVKELKINVSGGSKSIISGTTNLFSATTTGNSAVDASKLFAGKGTFYASGGSTITTNIDGKQVEASLTGNSSLTLNAKVNDMKIVSTGGSSVILSGNTHSFSCNCSGNSNIKAFDLVASDIIAVASGGCAVRVNAQNTLDIQSFGASTVTYMGNPAITTKTSGSSKIKRR